jgi:molybdenum cofactor cytidylyltransferase
MGTGDLTGTDKSRKLSFAAVILAAGASTRMGRPKLLLPWGGTSILGHLLNQWRSLCADRIAVVCAANDPATRQELDRLGVAHELRIPNPSPDQGMFGSIQCAAKWGAGNPSLTHLVIVLGDQPHLRRETLRALVEFAAANPDAVSQPARHGRPRHPVVMPRRVFQRLQTPGTGTLKEFLQLERVALCDVDDPGLDFDIDRPEDYEQAVRLFLEGA